MAEHFVELLQAARPADGAVIHALRHRLKGPSMD
jgi:hypothetical protein